MPRKRQITEQISDDEIMRYSNVPVSVAARYVGCSSCTLHYALQDGRAPFGFASCHENDDAKTVWTYNISPGLLVAYKRGTMECVKMQDLVKLLTEELEALFGGDRMTRIILKGFAATMDKLENPA